MTVSNENYKIILQILQIFIYLVNHDKHYKKIVWLL